MIALDSDCTAKEALEAFHAALLPATLEHAVHAPFYRELYGCADATATIDLAQLPFVSKQQIRAAGVSAQIRDGTICDEVFTSGTTGQPFVSPKGHVEQRYIQSFYQNLFAERREAPLLRALQINNPYHGHLVAIPVPIHSHKIGIYDEGSFRHGRTLLAEKHADPGVNPHISLLIGLERALRAFTLDAMRIAPDGMATRLTSIISYSQYLTRRWRQRHEAYWGCPVIDRFGLSEIFGGATEDPESGWWHFDPVCIPEVVGSRSRISVREGIGELVLTALYPFQQVQPLIRYLTGDLVEVTHTRSSRDGTLAIRPLGRARYGVPYPDADAFVVAPSEILEALDEIDGIDRIPRFRDASQVSDPFQVGHPCYAIAHRYEGGQTIVTILVQAPPADRAQLRRRIEDSLMESSLRFREAVDSKDARLEVDTRAMLTPDLISHAE